MLAAEDAERLGRWGEAFDAYLDLLAQRIAAMSDPGHEASEQTFESFDLRLIERVADLATLFGNFEAADNLLEALLLFCRDRSPLEADYTALKRAELLLDFFPVERTVEIWDQLLAAFPELRSLRFAGSEIEAWERGAWRRRWQGTASGGPPELLSRFYLAVGRALIGLGRFGEATVALGRGERHAHGAPDRQSPLLHALRTAQAHALICRGDFAAALGVLESIEGQIDPARQPGFLVRANELHAKLDLLQGRLGPALARLRRCVETCEAAGFGRAATTARLNLAAVLMQLNRTVEVAQILDGARGPAGDEALGRAPRTAFLRGLLEARTAPADPEMAPAPSVTAMWAPPEELPASRPRTGELPVPPVATDFLTWFEDRLARFQWQLGEGRLCDAEASLGGLRKDCDGAGSDWMSAILQTADAQLAYYRGQWDRAAQLVAAAARRLRASGLLPDLWQAQRLLSWCWKRLGRQEELFELFRDNEALLARIGESLSPADQVAFRLNKWTAEEETLAARIEELLQSRRRLASAPWYKKPWLWWGMARQAAALLDRVDRQREASAGRSPAASKERRRSETWRFLAARHGSAQLSFVVLPDRTLAILRSPFKVDATIAPLSKLALRDLVAQWHRLAAGRDFEEPEKARQCSAIAAKLADLLALPSLLDRVPGGIEDLSIVPDDVLHGFPFAAIPYRGKYLVERFALSLRFSHLPAVDRGPRAAGDRALLVGVSEGIGEAPPLPGARREIERTARWLASLNVPVETYLDEPAAKDSVVQSLQQAAFAHFACHGVFHFDAPDRSGLVLLPRRDRPEILSLAEIAALDLRRLEHITLSSCWGADNVALPGRCVISLPERLLRRGAGSVLGSLWPIDDNLAEKFMGRFYANLRTVPRAQALRQAQIECLRPENAKADSPLRTHPLFWAGFQLYGAPEALRLTRAVER